MKIVDELYHNLFLQIPSETLIEMLERIKQQKEQEIEHIKQKINKYQQKKSAEEALYQSMSPLRKFFTGRPASHHQAVEYIVHVKERLKLIEKIKQRITELDHILTTLRTNLSENEIVLSNAVIDELKQLREMEELQE
ncbi:hypothetical protein [Bacillus taeanensis]|uniref:DUF5082 domain-containing protein n=1 Tax=Bacillus taeanensis TaxID=273032 RepID=A0A366XVW9_9BACI|nr:hypothetical protein [Bacillus taeanensis]RBW69786.1 hypothetical protein DS031_09645 [Bacillus taeanensis]